MPFRLESVPGAVCRGDVDTFHTQIMDLHEDRRDDHPGHGADVRCSTGRSALHTAHRYASDGTWRHTVAIEDMNTTSIQLARLVGDTSLFSRFRLLHNVLKPQLRGDAGHARGPNLRKTERVKLRSYWLMSFSEVHTLE